MQDTLTQYEKFYDNLDKIESPYKGMMALTLIEFLESGYIMGYMSSYEDI